MDKLIEWRLFGSSFSIEILMGVYIIERYAREFWSGWLVFVAVAAVVFALRWALIPDYQLISAVTVVWSLAFWWFFHTVVVRRFIRKPRLGVKRAATQARPTRSMGACNTPAPCRAGPLCNTT